MQRRPFSRVVKYGPLRVPRPTTSNQPRAAAAKAAEEKDAAAAKEALDEVGFSAYSGLRQAEADRPVPKLPPLLAKRSTRTLDAQD